MELSNKAAILFAIFVLIFKLTSKCVDGLKSPDFATEQHSTSNRAGEQNNLLRQNINGSSVDDSAVGRDTIAVLPKPLMYRWFPKHNKPPTDSPDVILEEKEELENVLKLRNDIESVNSSRQVEAFFQDQFTVEIDDVFEEEGGNSTEQPMESSRKPSRQRRDLRSMLEVRRRNREIMRRRQEIERQRRMGTTTRAPYLYRPTSRPARRPKKNPSPTRRPQWRKPTRRPNFAPRSTRRTPTSRRPRTSRPRQTAKPKPNARKSYSTSMPQTAENRTFSNQTTMVYVQTSPELSTPSMTTNSSKRKQQKNTTKPINSGLPKYQGRNQLNRGKGKNPTKPTLSKPRKGMSSKKKSSKAKSSGMKTVLVVKPVLSSRGTKTTTTVMRSLPKRNDVAQNRNSKPRITFSKWGAWGACSAKLCGRTGRQLRTRTCFGDRLTPADYATCNYDALVNHRQCKTLPCDATEKPSPDSMRRTRWSAWSKCSVTCGTGGEQTRTKVCYEVAPDGSDERTPAECQGETVETRPCQYSVSCPMWDEWSEWSSCSKTCGPDGVSFRDRKCIVKRIVTFPPRGGNGQRRQFDNAAVPRPMLREPANMNKKSAVKYPNSKRSVFYSQGNVFLKKGNQKIFIVDAPKPKQDSQLPSQRPSPQFHNDRAIKELVDFELCSGLGGYSEEEKRCIQERCPAEWGMWTEWSPCSVTCGLGISRRERACSGETYSGSCVGRKYAYRRCYAPPCWGEWSRWSRCSVTCGSEPGTTQRSRECLGVTTVMPEYLTCGVDGLQAQECYPDKKCPGDEWGSWGPYGDCSATCNGGYRRRERKCLATKCTEASEDFARCNIHECPSWSDWSRYSCCSVTCGEGTRKRTRECLHGEVGSEGCIGKVAEFSACYQAPCTGRKKSVFNSLRCGVSVSKPKTIAKLRIYGGAKASAHAWPWQSSWQHRDSTEAEWQHFCGATLLHPRWVITASHCTEESEYIVNHRNPGEDWSVVVGMTKLYKDGERYFVERIFIHPRYEYKSVTKNDVALLKLRKMVPLTKEVMPACLPKGVRPTPGERCFVTGWGYTTSDSDASLSLSLREASVPIMRFSRCRSLGDYYRYFLNPTIHMCAGNPVTAAADSCTGDSGGPLVCARNKRWYLGAVTSFGFADCGTPGHVGIYAPMETYEQWVRNTVESNTYERC